VLDNTPGGFTLRISSDSSTVDCFHWAPSPWQNHLKKLPKDSGWWSRTVDDRITRVIVMNEDSVSVTSPSETLTLSFDGPFEGVLDRDGDTWIVKPDSYNAVPPKLVRFEMRSGGKARPVEVVRKSFE